MKKIIALLLTAVMVLAFAACGSKTADVTDADVIGSWEQEHNQGDSYKVITFAADGTGDITTMPEGLAVPLTYEVNGNTITAHLGSEDDNSTMEYTAETNQISYDGSIYKPAQEVDNANVVGSWEQEHNDGDSYKVITFAEDGTGEITTMPEGLAVPFTYETQGDAVITHLGSEDDYTVMEYLHESTQISYDDCIYNPVENDAEGDIVGSWEQPHNEGDSYMVITFAADGTGEITTMPDEISVPMAYEKDGTVINAHLGSADDNTPMEYVASDDQILYDGVLYSRVAD